MSTLIVESSSSVSTSDSRNACHVDDVKIGRRSSGTLGLHEIVGFRNSWVSFPMVVPAKKPTLDHHLRTSKWAGETSTFLVAIPADYFFLSSWTSHDPLLGSSQCNVKKEHIEQAKANESLAKLSDSWKHRERDNQHCHGSSAKSHKTLKKGKSSEDRILAEILEVLLADKHMHHQKMREPSISLPL